MIDFGCKQFKLMEVMKCALGLTKAEAQLLNSLIKTTDWLTTEKISKKSRLHLSTIQRAVKKLFVKGVLDRKQKNISDGGYFYVYRMKKKQEIKRLIMKTIREWESNLERELLKWK